jgi:hypothetical protein
MNTTEAEQDMIELHKLVTGGTQQSVTHTDWSKEFAIKYDSG